MRAAAGSVLCDYRNRAVGPLRLTGDKWMSNVRFRHGLWLRCGAVCEEAFRGTYICTSEELTFVLLLDVCAAQAHQARLERHDSHLPIATAVRGGEQATQRLLKSRSRKYNTHICDISCPSQGH